MDPVSKAQSADSSIKKVVGRPWPKGVSGNPGGRRKKPLAAMCEKLIDKNAAEIEEIIMDVIRSRRMAGVLMLREVAERAEGKVSQEIELNTNAQQMNDAELLKRLEGLLGLEPDRAKVEIK